MLTSVSKGAILDAELHTGVTSEVKPTISDNDCPEFGNIEYACSPSIINTMFSKK